MIGYIESSSFPVYTYGEMIYKSFYIKWTPSYVSSGTFSVGGSVHNYSDYSNGVFSEFDGVIIEGDTLRSASITYLETNIEDCEFFMVALRSSLQSAYLPNCKILGTSDYTTPPRSTGGFAYCTSLSKVSLPVCEVIGADAFQDCYELKSITLPSCRYVGTYAFGNCSSLSYVNLPVCSYIYTYAFQSCRSLRNIVIPQCERIEGAAFMWCGFYSISLPMCSYLSGGVFYGCSSLTYIDLPVCEVLAGGTFENCNHLSSIVLPVCSSIGQNTFKGCTILKSITLGSTSVCSLANSGVFSGTDILSYSGSIFVPYSLVSAYKRASGWKFFSNRIYPINN